MTQEKKTDIKSSGDTKQKKTDEKLKEKKSKDIPPTKVSGGRTSEIEVGKSMPAMF